jgi:hypothetical protein
MTYLNWYKLAESKGIENVISKMRNDHRFEASILDWIQGLDDKTIAGKAISILRSNPSISLDEIKKKLEIYFKIEPLTQKEILFLQTYPKLKDWASNILLKYTGEGRISIMKKLRLNLNLISIWYNSVTVKPELVDLTLDQAIKDSNDWLKIKNEMAYRTYGKIDQENIIKKYNNGWTWQRITTRRDMSVEGRKQKICIGLEEAGYIKAVLSQKGNAYSLRDEVNNPLVTAYLTHNNVLLKEIKSYENGDPTVYYYEFIKDLISTLGVRYSQEDYLKNIQNDLKLKNWDDIQDKDLENDDFLKKMINNMITRGDWNSVPEWAENWIIRIFNGDQEKIPQTWIESVNKTLKYTNDKSLSVFPFLLYDWAESNLNNGSAPKWFIDSLKKYMKDSGIIPEFAQHWMENVLYGAKDGPPEWIKEIISSAFDKKRNIPKFLFSWIKNMFKEEEYSIARSWYNGKSLTFIGPAWLEEKLKNYLTDHYVYAMSSEGDVYLLQWMKSEFIKGKKWVHDILKNKERSIFLDFLSIDKWNNREQILELVKDEILSSMPNSRLSENAKEYIYNNKNNLPEWVKNKIAYNVHIDEIDSILGKINYKDPKNSWVITKIRQTISDGRDLGENASKIAYEIFNNNQGPEWMVSSIEKSIDKGCYPNFIKKWIMDEFKKDNPVEWLISRFKKHLYLMNFEGLEDPGWRCAKFYEIENAFSHWSSKAIYGKHKNWLLDYVYKFISKNGDIPGWAYDWATTNLETGNPPKRIKDIITSKIVTNQKIPYWAEEWVRRKLNENNIPIWLSGPLYHMKTTNPDKLQRIIENKTL